MSLSECVQCVKKGFIYTGIKSQPCVYSLSEITRSSSEVDAAATKVDCVISFIKPDEGLFGWGWSTAADLSLIYGIIIGILIIILGYEWMKRKKLGRKIKSIFFALVNSGLFPALLSLLPVPARSFVGYCSYQATRLGQYLQQRDSLALAQAEHQQQNNNITPFHQIPGRAHVLALPPSPVEFEDVTPVEPSHTLIDI